MSIRLPEAIRSRLDALSESTGRSTAELVREAVLTHIDQLEWAYGVASRAKAIRGGVRETRPIDDVARELGYDPDALRTESTAD